MIVALLGVTGQVNAIETPRKIVNDLTNGSATWYSDANKSTPITSVPYSAAAQTLYIDIQPAEGYWTSADDLKGLVEKYVSPSAADSRTRSTDISIAQYQVKTVSGQTYAANGGGLYQVSIPGMGSSTDADKITKFVLTAKFKKIIVIGGEGDSDADATISVSPTEFTYNGKDQKPEVKITLKAGNTVISATEYDVKYKDAKGTAVTETKNAGSYTLEITNKEGADYAFSGKTTASYTIKPAELTITADEKTKVEGEKDPALTYKSEGLVSGDAITGALTRATGETAGTYAITQGTLSAGTNYTVTYKGANLTITAAKPVTPEETTYQVVVAKATGGNVVTSVTEAKKGQQVNMIVTPAKGYYLSSLSVVPAAGGSIQPGVTFDKDKNMFNFFIMPASDVTIYATFDAVEPNQNIFIFKAKYGEVISHVLHAEPGQQVNLETRIKDGFDNVVLDELYVYNEKGERLPISTIEDPKEGLVYYFFMKGDKAYVYNTFKGTNGTVDESKPVPPDNYLYLLSDAFNNFINAGNGVSGVQMAMSLLANILATFTPEGELTVNMGDDLGMALLNLKSGWQIKIDFNGAPIKVLYPSLLEGLGEDGTISSGVFYKMLSDGNLELLLKTGMLPLLIQSITIIAPEPDPTAINDLKADGAASEIYDLRGRKVDATNLRKGIYIRDGRKVVIK